MSRRESKQRARRPWARYGLLASKPSQPPWLRARLLFEQLETRILPGSLLVSPLGDAVLLGAGHTMTP